MMVFSFLGPVVASVLYVIVFQKAGFRGARLAVCAAPVLSAVLSNALMGFMYMGEGSMFAFILITTVLSFAPLLVLAFKAWPPVVSPPPHASTENT
ncbi:MAG: hypothetical protein WBA90_04840 [Albidovulum sp.]